MSYTWDGGVPVLYVGTDGKLYGGSVDDRFQLAYQYSFFQVTSNAPVNDGRWHNVALVVDGVAQRETLYLDGQLVGSDSGIVFWNIGGSLNQIGTGFTGGFWPATPWATGLAGMASSARSRTSGSGAKCEQPSDQPGHDHGPHRHRAWTGGVLSVRRGNRPHGA